MLTWVEINAVALRHNLKAWRRLMGDRALIMPVIKANAYGHGLAEVAKICVKDKNADRICVVSLDEALELRKLGIKKPIIVLAIYSLDDSELLKQGIEKKIIFPLYTLEQAKKLGEWGRRLKKKVTVHLKIDIGTSRIGVLPANAAQLCQEIKKFRHLHLEGVFGHFAASEDDRARTKKQWRIFQNTINVLSKQGINFSVKHVACSAASVTFPQASSNAVRAGLGLYGLYPAEKIRQKIFLKPALSWFTTIIQVKNIPKGSKISYGGDYTTKRPTKLAIIPVGYADGYDRSLSNKAFVLIKGKRCPVRGRICMNLAMVDVTAVKGAKTGDRVVLIGKDRQKTVSVDELAKIAGTINYEIVSRINPTIARIVVA